MRKKPSPRPKQVHVQCVFVTASDGRSVLRGVNHLLRELGIKVRMGGQARALGPMRYLTLRRV